MLDEASETCGSNPNLAECGPAVQMLELPDGLIRCFAVSATTHGSSLVGGRAAFGESHTRDGIRRAFIARLPE